MCWASRIGSTPLISWVSGPITPLTFLVSIWVVAVTPSATSQPVSPVTSLIWWPLTPPALLITAFATWLPWSMAWPRLASRPVKQDRTPYVTGPELLPPDDPLDDAQAASSRTPATAPETVQTLDNFIWASPC